MFKRYVGPLMICEQQIFSSLAVATLVLVQTSVLNTAETHFNWEKMSESKKRAYETSSEEGSVLASKGSATAIKRKNIPSQKFIPADHEACPCLVPLSSGKGSELVLCTACKSDFHGGRFDCKQPVESKSYKEFKVTGKFFSSFKSVSFSLSLPFSLSLVLMQQTYSFSALVNIDSTSL